MRIVPLLIIYLLTNSMCLGQKSDLLKAYKSKSKIKLQTFIDNWENDTTFNIDSNEIKFNDTLGNIYGIINTVYNKVNYNTKCVFMQESLHYNLVDNLDKDTLDKRAIILLQKMHIDSIMIEDYYKKGNLDLLIDGNLYGQELYKLLKCGDIKILTKYIKFKDKKILPLNNKYYTIISDYILDNSIEKKNERTKRLMFIKDEINLIDGDIGKLEIMNFPYLSDLTIDSKFQNAEIELRGNTSGSLSTYKKINNKWTFIETKKRWVQ